MPKALPDTLDNLDRLDVSFERRAAMTKAIRTGRLRDLPWAALRPPLDLPAGLVVDERYRLEGRIGSGGFGGVFRATDLLTGRITAVKVLDHPSPEVSRRMLQEIAVLRRLDLPCVVGFLDEGELQGRPYVVMHFMKGQTFPGSDHDRSWRALGPRVLALAEALARVHAVGVLHRDIKPDNVLWVDGRPVLIDFGLAMAEQLLFEPDEDLAGSPAFLAPEQYLGDEPTERSDLYSFGVLLYEALAGELPFAGSKAMDVITELLTQEPPPLAERCDVPADVSELVHQLLAKNPDDRPASALQVVSRLRACVPVPDGLPLTKPAPRPADLEELFAGPEKLHQLRSDPARVLWERTGGDAQVTRQTLAAWIRAGVARVEDGRIAMDRDVVDRMMSGMPVDPLRGDGVGADGIAVDQRRLWIVVDALAPWASEARLAAVLGWGARRLEEGLRELAARGLVALAPDVEEPSWLAVRTPPPPDGANARRLHDLLAEHVPADANAYLHHLVAAGRMDDVPAAALRVARARRGEGRHVEAWLAAREGLAAERRLGLESTEALVLAAELVLEGSMGPELEVVALEARRRRQLDIAGLCSFARALHRGDADPNALQAIDLSAFPTLRDWPYSLWAYLHQNLDLDELRSWLDEVRDELDPYEAKFLQSRIEHRSWNMRLAAELCEASVGPNQHGPRAASRRLNATNRWLDAGAFDRAEQQLSLALAELGTIRSGALWAFGTHLERVLAYRTGKTMEPDLEFVEALSFLHSPTYVAPYLFQEAVFAWRRGQERRVRELCEPILAIAHLRPPVALMAEAMVAVLQGTVAPDLAERAYELQMSIPLRAQVGAAQRMAGGALSSEMRRRIHSDLRDLQYPVDAPLEWLSPREVTRVMEEECRATT